ncbi:hypothetical protein [Enterococcus faecium]|uniref:hypothetical protein n=1 Tax=Enterococcus faecium TaxID=1352 RepID=UPI0030C838F9
MVLSRVEIKKELKKMELREIYRRYCGQNEITEKDLRQLKGFDQVNGIEKAIGIRIDSMKELQDIRQEKCKEEEIKSLTELLKNEGLAKEYLTREYKKMSDCITDNKHIEEEKTVSSPDLLSQDEELEV